MKRSSLLFLVIGMLPALLAAATAAPTRRMFNGQVTSLAAAGRFIGGAFRRRLPPMGGRNGRQHILHCLGLPGRRAHPLEPRARRRRQKRRRRGTGRDGRISVHEDGGDGLNISSAPGEEKGPVSWGVLLFLNQVRDGRCRVLDMDVLAPDRAYDLGGERLAWLGSVDGEQGLEYLRSLSVSAEHKLRKELVFALYLFNGPAAVADLIGLARLDPDMDIRKDAIFWLGQKASAAAVAALGEVIAAPEELEIKKAAVFALSQLPEEKGTPLLLGIARQHPQPRVRKEAIFWLGQSGDPKALDFFEEILLK